VRELLLRKADVKVENAYGNSALNWAAAKGHTDVVSTLLVCAVRVCVLEGSATRLLELRLFLYVAAVIKEGACVWVDSAVRACFPGRRPTQSDIVPWQAHKAGANDQDNVRRCTHYLVLHARTSAPRTERVRERKRKNERQRDRERESDTSRDRSGDGDRDADSNLAFTTVGLHGIDVCLEARSSRGQLGLGLGLELVLGAGLGLESGLGSEMPRSMRIYSAL